MKYLKTIWNFLKSHRTLFLCASTVFMYTLIFWVKEPVSTFIRDVERIEKAVIKREALLEDYAIKALNSPVDRWLELDDFPEDMVIYKYNADTIQSWINQFPIGNDDVDLLPLWYRLSSLNTRSLYNNPLVYISGNEQFVNLGSGWYIINIYKQGLVKVIAGLLVKTEYLATNSVLVSKINQKLKANKKLIIKPVNSDEGIVVTGKDGGSLFSVSDDSIRNIDSPKSFQRWLAMLFALLSLYSFLYDRRKLNTYILYVLGITVLRLLCFRFDNYLSDYQLFSPLLYADSGIFSSLGSLLLNNLYVLLLILGLYLMRRKIIIYLNKAVTLRKQKTSKIIVKCVIYLLPLLIFIYINFTLQSLINNSSIVLELYRLDELSIYSFLAYFSYALLFIVLLLSLQMVVSITKPINRSSLLTYRITTIYVFLISLYILLLVSFAGFKKETERSKVWTNKLSVERDIGLELLLRSQENKILNDPINSAMLNFPQGGANLLKDRLDELYLKGVSQKYEVKLTICRPNDVILYNQGQHVIDCNRFYQAVQLRGLPLADNSNFYFLNNYNGRVSYLGIFNYLTIAGPINLYIELDSRYMKDVLGYPSLLFDYKQVDNFNMPYSYSYGKYVDGRLVVYRGRYNYPINLEKNEFKDGFSVISTDGYVHFINKSSKDNVIVITRDSRNFLLYLVSFSYLMLFNGGLLFLFLRLRRINKNALKVKLPKNSFRRKITYLIITSLVFALICMGVGSVWFSVNFYNENNRLQMEEKLLTVQSTLSDLCKYTDMYNQLNTPEIFQSMDRLASNTQVDINLYDPHGRLMRSTQPELFNRYLLSSRMNSDAFHKLVGESKRQLIHQEQIAELSYYSLYAPIFNSVGKLIAIANIPYFAKTSDFRGDLSSIIATIINIYLLLLLAAIFGGSIVSNQISKPLVIISSKMKKMDVSQKAEHIDYKSKDELGVLVGAYNKMVEDLEESTKSLAQTEREHAWSEMARQIAHEIKNPLTPMRLSIQHLIRLKQRNVEGWQDKFEDVGNSILDQIEILSNTASEFSSFAKFYYEESSEISLFSLLDEQKILFDTHDNIRITFSYTTEEAFVFARRGQIIRVIVNLLSNAVQAVELNGGGYVKIFLTQDDDNVTVSFEDNGAGVNSENESKLFKPNFTTKNSGTGLGLAICRNIIEQSGGYIYYKKSEFGGANFTFNLPRHKG